MRQIAFKVEHLDRILARDGKFVGAHRGAQKFEDMPYNVTFMDGDEPICCGGSFEYWKGRGEAWAVVSEQHRELFIKVHNMARKYFENLPIRRIELAVERSFENGHRWAIALGFQLEAPVLRAYLPNGKDATLYARVR